MAAHSTEQKISLEVALPSLPPKTVPLNRFPFLIGHASEPGNHLQLDGLNISRRCAAIVTGRGGHRLEDRGNHAGVFVNGQRVQKKTLRDGDTISFGSDDASKLIFRSTFGAAAVASMLTRMGGGRRSAGAQLASGLSKLNLLIEATSLLHAALPLDSVLNSMLDHAIALTKADRGLLLEPDSNGVLKGRLARSSKGESLDPCSIEPLRELLDEALAHHAGIMSGDPELAAADARSTVKTIHIHPHSFIAAPLYALPCNDVGDDSGDEPGEIQMPCRGELLGAIYLDSTHPTAFYGLVRQIFEALAVEAGSILENARHMERERARRLLEHEMSLARAIQQALLPRGFRDYPHLTATGMNHPCIDVGGDYFDVFPVGEKQTAILIADVSGHGLGAALLTTMLQGALSGMTAGEDPLRVFNRINQFLCEHSEVHHYATMFFSLLGPDGLLRYIKAAHPSPILLRGGTATELYHEGSFPVGLLPDVEFSAESVRLEPGDTLVLYSDGVTEAEDPEENQFGVARLRALLAGRENTRLDELQQTIFDAVDTFCRGAAQLDDITVLISRYRAPA